MKVLGKMALLVSLMIASTNAEHDYNLVFDAGSSGTRVYLYHKNANAPQETHQRVLETKYQYTSLNELKIKPGISSFPDSIEAANSIEPLLGNASLWLQELNLHQGNVSCALGATAGVRILGHTMREELMGALEKKIKDSKLCDLAPNAVRVLSGEEEAAYGWAAVQYLSELKERNPVGAIEMGGASTQITARPPHEGDILANFIPLTIDSGATERLYGQSFLRFGANEYQKRFIEYLLMNNARGATVENPCWPKPYTSPLTIGTFTTTMVGTSDAKKCEYHSEKFLSSYLAPSVPCLEGSQSSDSCTLLGRYIPDQLAKDTAFVLFGSIKDYWKYFKKLEDDNTSTLSKLRGKLLEICDYEYDAFAAYAINKELEINEALGRCSLGMYIYQLLTKAYFFDTNKSLSIVSKINDVSVSWTLGQVISGNV